MKSRGHIITISQPKHETISEKVQGTVADWLCKWVYNGLIRNLFISAPYLWDGASIMRLGWTLIGLTPFGVLDACSLPHDELYRSRGGRRMTAGCTLTNDNGNTVFVDRAEADWLFFYAMRRFKVKGIRDEVAYGIVRTFGRQYWGGPAPKR